MRLTSTLCTRVMKWSQKYGNLPDRYIKRVMTDETLIPPKGKPQFLPRRPRPKYEFIGLNRPWTNEHKMLNMKRMPYIHVEPIKNWSFFRGDRVEILAGRDKGKQGIVKEVIQERNWVIVEGLNTELKKIDRGKIVTYMREEKPLLVPSQVVLVDPSDKQGTKFEWRYTEAGDPVRVSCRTGRIIPIPVSSEETRDYKTPDTYKAQEKDTPETVVAFITFEAKLKTFEMDIMDEMRIKEDRVPKKCYWY